MMTKFLKIPFACIAILVSLRQVAGQTQMMCEEDTIAVVTDNNVRQAARRFLGSFTKSCNTGQRPDLCQKPSYNAAMMERAITRIMDYRALEGTSVFNGFVEECKAAGFAPVLIDETAVVRPTKLSSNSVNGAFSSNREDNVDREDIPNREETTLNSEVRGIELLHCLPRACVKNSDDMAKAFHEFEGRTNSEKIGLKLQDPPNRLDLNDLNDEACNPKKAGWSYWSNGLRAAYNKYVSQINQDCSSNTPASYCSTLYRSLGTFHAQSLYLFNHFDTDEFQEYKEACKKASGHLCAFDMDLRFVGTRSSPKNWWKTDRAEVSHEFLGYPECFANSCGWNQAMAIADRFYVKQLLNKMKQNRRLREVQSEFADRLYEFYEENLEAIDETITSLYSFDEETSEEVQNTFTNRSALNDEPSKKVEEPFTENLLSVEQSEEDRPLMIEARFAAIDVTSYDDIPEGSFLDYMREHENKQHRLLSHSSYEGQEKCGRAADRCDTMLSNFCLR